MRKTARTFIAAGMAAVLGALGAGSALAAPTTEQLTRAVQTMLTRADIPDGIRVSTKGYGFTANEGTGPQPWLCSTNNKVRLGPEAVQQYQVELGDLDTRRDAALQQNLYLYGSVADAQAAWEKVKTRAAKCTGNTRETDGEGDMEYTWSQRVRNGQAQFDVNGVQGLWIHSNSDNKSKDYEFIDDEYVVLYLVGNAIQTLEYDRDYKQDITGAERATLQALGKALAERWGN